MNAATKIALVYPGCNKRGGVERCVRELARTLADRYQVTFLGEDFDPAGMHNVRFLPVPGVKLPGSLAPVSFRLRARRILRQNEFDVIISWGSECPPGDILAVASVHRAWLRQGGRVPTRFGDAPNWIRYILPRHAVRLLLERHYFKSRSDSIVSVLSEQNLQEVSELYGLARSRFTVIPNGYSSDDFSAERTRDLRAARRAELGLQDDDVLALLVANELHRKGFATLLRATARLSSPKLKIAVVGRAPIDGYRNQIDILGLSGSVTWHGPSDDVAQWYAPADLFVMPSQYEAYPLVVIEALASGLPVITTAIAGCLDAVQPGVNGLLMSDPGDDEELAGLLRLALSTSTRSDWRSAAPASVARLEWRSIGAQYANLIDGWLAST